MAPCGGEAVLAPHPVFLFRSRRGCTRIQSRGRPHARLKSEPGRHRLLFTALTFLTFPSAWLGGYLARYLIRAVSWEARVKSDHVHVRLGTGPFKPPYGSPELHLRFRVTRSSLDPIPSPENNHKCTMKSSLEPERDVRDGSAPAFSTTASRLVADFALQTRCGQALAAL